VARVFVPRSPQPTQIRWARGKHWRQNVVARENRRKRALFRNVFWRRVL